MNRVYTYQNCSTCRKATNWLKSRGIEFQEIAIRETPPGKEELEAMLEKYQGDLRRLFNTSGMDYRALGLKDKLPNMSRKEAFHLLGGNGNLVKRPFLLAGSFKAAGFKEDEWAEGFS